MPQYHSQQLIGFLSEQTEQYLHIAISRWQMIASQQFSYKPAPDKWSAAQCLLHLNSYGEYYLPAIEKAIETAGRHSTKAAIFHSGWLGNYFTEMMLPGEDGMPAKKMSAMKGHIPQVDADSFEVIAAFIDQQEKLLALLQKAREVDLGKIRVPISIAKFIRLKLGDVFLFLIAHNHRHILQAERTLTQAGVAGFPIGKFGLKSLQVAR